MEHNRSTFSILFYLNTSKKKKSGKCPIIGRISVDGESKAFSTGMDILPDEWSAQDGLAIGKSNAHINKQIESYKSELNTHYKAMVESKGYITAESLKNALRGIGTKQNTLMQEFAELVEEKRKSVGVKIKESTYLVYPNAYRHLKDFLSLKYGVTDMVFGQVDTAFVDTENG